MDGMSSVVLRPLSLFWLYHCRCEVRWVDSQQKQIEQQVFECERVIGGNFAQRLRLNSTGRQLTRERKVFKIVTEVDVLIQAISVQFELEWF